MLDLVIIGTILDVFFTGVILSCMRVPSLFSPSSSADPLFLRLTAVQWRNTTAISGTCQRVGSMQDS